MEAALVPLGPSFVWNAEGLRVAGGKLLGDRALRKSDIGAAAGGLVHAVARTMGVDGGSMALRLLDTVSSLAHEFLRMRPPSMTGDDLQLAGAAALGAFPPVPDGADEETMADAMAARHAARVSDPIKRGAMNSFVAMVDFGVKGTRGNLNQMYGGAGVQAVNGAPPPKVSCGRALPIFRAHDTSALSRGFAASSLVDGLSVAEAMLNVAAARVGLVIGRCGLSHAYLIIRQSLIWNVVERRLEVPDAGYSQRKIAQVCSHAHLGSVSFRKEKTSDFDACTLYAGDEGLRCCVRLDRAMRSTYHSDGLRRRRW